LGYYIGYVQTNATLRYFGVPSSLVEFSTTEYIVRATGSILFPIMLAGVLTAILAFAHPRLVAVLQRAQPVARRLYLGALIWAGLFLAGFAALAAFRGAGSPSYAMGFWLLLAAGLAAALYGLTLQVQTYTGGRHSFSPVARLAVAVLIAGALFTGLTVYLNELGRARGQALSYNLQDLPHVRVLSTISLNIEGPGVSETSLEQEEAAYRYRYEGLVFMIQANEHHFLLPQDWVPGEPVIVLREGDGIRFEYFEDRGDRAG
jgi:hypothetical protein